MAERQTLQEWVPVCTSVDGLGYWLNDCYGGAVIGRRQNYTLLKTLWRGESRLRACAIAEQQPLISQSLQLCENYKTRSKKSPPKRISMIFDHLLAAFLFLASISHGTATCQFFSKKRRRGRQLNLAVGDVFDGDYLDDNDWDNDIKSYRVGENEAATVCTGENFDGECMVVRGVGNLPRGVRGEISSVNCFGEMKSNSP